jgi:copper chaperone NosL
MTRARTARRWGLAAALSLATGHCAKPAPRPVAYGREVCAYCHMTVADPRFGGQLVTRKGQVFVFDDAGCLAAFVHEGTVHPDQIAALWVNDFLVSDRLLDATTAVYLEPDSTRTPMGSGVIAVPPGPPADTLQSRLGGQTLTWQQVLDRSEVTHSHAGQPTT